jgi:hypothetical protein
MKWSWRILRHYVHISLEAFNETNEMLAIITGRDSNRDRLAHEAGMLITKPQTL